MCQTPSQALGPSDEETSCLAWLSSQPGGGGGRGFPQPRSYHIAKRDNAKRWERKSRGEMRSPRAAAQFSSVPGSWIHLYIKCKAQAVDENLLPVKTVTDVTVIPPSSWVCATCQLLCVVDYFAYPSPRFYVLLSTPFYR